MAAFGAPAKINLFLHVLAREAGGFHQIETLFCRLELADALEIEAGEPGIALRVDGADTGPLDDNLVMRAARLFAERTDMAPAIRITLRKRIPAGAGLGGGSSDAAATLRALAAKHSCSENALLAMATELGSDVPFFASGAALALGWGRGERLLALPPLPARPVLIVAPARPIATADAYRALAAQRAIATTHAVSRVLSAAQLSEWSSVEAVAGNDFDEIAFQFMPALRHVRDALREHGARLALVCGSGSALFGVFATVADRDGAARALRPAFPQHSIIATSTA